MKYLWTKFRRDLMHLFPQFIAVFVMAMLSVTIFSGMESVWTGMDLQSQDFYEDSSLCDAWIYGNNLGNENANKVRELENVTNVTSSMSITCDVAGNKTGEHSDVNVTTVNDVSNQSPVVVTGDPFDMNSEGVWLDKTFADKNDYHVGDWIRLSYGMFPEQDYQIRGLVMSPEFIYYTASATQTMPDYEKHGYAYFGESQMEKMTGMIIYNQMRIDVKEDVDMEQLEKEIKDRLGDDFFAMQTREDFNATAQMSDEILQTKKMAIMFTCVFILLALLTMYTTMTRLVRNQTQQIGTMKAIGMTNGEIRRHYLMFGLIVPAIGAITGVFLGRVTVARVVMEVKKTTLTLPEWSLEFSWGTLIVVILIVVICMFATIWASGKILKHTPAETMRGLDEKASRNKSLKKVKSSKNYTLTWVMRDTGRNKIRYLIGVVGVLGSMMLMIAGFGMYDSINASNDFVFSSQYSYSYTGSLSAVTEEAKQMVDNDANGAAIQWMKQTSADVHKEDDKKMSSIITILDEGDYFTLEREENGEKLTLPEEGVILSHRLSEQTGLKEGDEITFNVTGVSHEFTATVKDITSVRTPQGIYLSRTSWESMGESFLPNIVMMNDDGYQNLKNCDALNELVSIDTQKDNVDELSESVYTVIKLLIIASFLLSVVILYNMGMMNYEERYREYATMKVIGYTNREIRNIVMTDCFLTLLPGWLLGIPVGFAFLRVFINVVSFDSFEWKMQLEPLHFVILSIFVILCAVIVHLVISHKANKIVMTEALKSVE